MALPLSSGVCVVQQLMSVLIRESGRLFLTDASTAPTPPNRQGQRAAETLPPPPAPMMDLRPPPRQSASPRRASDPLYDNCPSRSPERSSATPPPLPDPAAPAPSPLDSWDVPCWAAEPGGSAGGASLSSRSSSPGELTGRNAHESTLSVYDNLDVPPAGPGAPPAPPAPPRPPLEDSGDSSSWSSCEIVLEEAKPGAGPAFGPFPFRADAGDPPPDFPSVQALLALAGPDLDPAASPSSARCLVAGLKQQISRQKEEYEAQIRSLEKRNEALQGEVSGLRANLEQHRRWYKVAEIKMRNAERARADADRRNTALQQEMEQFFDTFGELNVEAKKTERIAQGF
ncbi:rho GTPase-activating protein 24-like [Conger conger]|uniref:rho GTPase-activating protein 24-like n=1 Tax=Conger conger TaxID=82655 RepID=UPI002A5A951C|nr:rho GTPase-activating protein 24-like [Conger conger]